ncbi:MAG: hypothetical protein HY293_10600 [Planctomycetes bacterium]|nr:hypothetical protein [Planctomycetota bacterium]
MNIHRLDAFVNLSCVCRSVHTLSRDHAVDDSGTRLWQCVPCGSRFMIAHVPGTEAGDETILPVFIEEESPSGDAALLGRRREDWDAHDVPPDLRFECRCGSRLVVLRKSYGCAQRCPRCAARIAIGLGYDGESGRPVPIADYLEA